MRRDDFDSPQTSRRDGFSIRILPASAQDPCYQEILANYEEAISSGLSKDEAASFARISARDHDRLLVQQVEANPTWLTDMELMGKTNLKATARVNAARRVREGDAGFVLPIAQATNADLSPKQVSIGVKMDMELLSPEQKTSLLGKFKSISPVIDVIAETNHASD